MTSDSRFAELLKSAPEIAQAVNEFRSETAQLQMLAALLRAFDEGLGAPLGRDEDLQVGDGSLDERAAADEVPRGEDRSEKGTRRRDSRSTNRDAAALRVIPDLNLRPKDKASLRDFVAQKAPASNEQLYAVVIYYLTKVLEVEQVGLNHLYSALKDLEQRVSPRLSTVLSNAASRHGWFDTRDRSNITMKVHGENFVEHDLPASGKKKLA
jgi:hypothetical protein